MDIRTFQPVTSDHTQANRVRIERLLRLAELLAPADRQLLEALYERGLSPAQLVRLTGRSRSAVSRHARRLVMRLESPHVRAILQYSSKWPPIRRRIAHARYIRGLSQRSAAGHLQLTLHRVRLEDQLIRAVIFDAIAQRVAPQDHEPRHDGPMRV